MTEYKEGGVTKQKSLYLGLFYTIVIGILLAVAVLYSIRLPATQIINRYYVTDEMSSNRREAYLEDLQSYVTENKIDHKNTAMIAQWVRDNPYVYLLVYETYEETDPKASLVRATLSNRVYPGARDKLSELPGSRIDESIPRETLISEATSYGYYKIKLLDGDIIVAITEYTQNLYLSVFSLISFFAAGLTFILVLVRYIRVIIERIKRFESDVTIVSELDMSYEIVSEGSDEISKLSKNVETMRRTMLDHIKNEHEAREANTELITSISHDIRTPLTVLMGYIEMMKERGADDDVMKSYIEATENTAMLLKQLSDDMLKYSLAFGETERSVRMEEYDAATLMEQLFSEHILLLREKGYDIHTESVGEIPEGSSLRTDAQNLMRIVDNVFSNISKYADPDYPIYITPSTRHEFVTVEVKNRIRKNPEGAESNGIGLKTCTRLASLVAKRFEYEKGEDEFTCRLVLKLLNGKSSDSE